MVVGLTGGIASGKSLCSDYLAREYRIPVVDADVLAREVVSVGSEALTLIQAEFGEHVIMTDGSLDRARMREIIFADATARQRLNAIIHPRVRQSMLARLDAQRKTASPYQIMSVPLLFENGLERYADAVVVVDVAQSIQVDRLQARDGGGSAHKIIAAQMSRSERLGKAQYVIDNNGSELETKAQLDHLHRILTELSDITSSSDGRLSAP